LVNRTPLAASWSRVGERMVGWPALPSREADQWSVQMRSTFEGMGNLWKMKDYHGKTIIRMERIIIHDYTAQQTSPNG
jgi:hypothetical protein